MIDNMSPEIPAQHRPMMQALLYQSIVLPALRNSFARVRVHAEGLPTPGDDPLIIYLTHSSWWDAYMLFLISEQLLPYPRQNYIMMEAKQLRRYRFFRWCGAFSIDRHNPDDTQRSLEYIAKCLCEQSGRLLWIFPQGKITHPDQRPIILYPGIARIISRIGSATLWPMALRYEFRGEQRAEALLRAGLPWRVSNSTPEQQLLIESTARLSALADVLRDDVLYGRLDDYHVLLHGRIGIDRWFDQLRGKWLPGRNV